MAAWSNLVIGTKMRHYESAPNYVKIHNKVPLFPRYI